MASRNLSRRGFLQQAGAIAAMAAMAGAEGSPVVRADEPKHLPNIAGVNSIYRFKSHAYHIEGRFLDGYTREGVLHRPAFKLRRMFNDQYPIDDLSRELCPKRGVELCDTVAQALGGGKAAPGELDVDAVLLVCEHGEYPQNELGQILYPRFELFEQIVKVFRASRRAVPVFVDKHLSYDHAKAARMVATARELNFPLMAGSSLPVTWRNPEVELPLESPVKEGLALFGFERKRVEIYLFHALEVLQCMMERRQGGETGVRQVTCLEGAAVWKAADAGLWSRELMTAALARCPSCNVGKVEDNVTNPLLLLVEYRDGTRGAALNLMEQISDLAFAGRVAGRAEPVASHFVLPPPPGARFFDPLVWQIEQFFATGKSPYPVERTLLTSTALDFGLRSLKNGGRPIADAALDVRYQPPAESGFARGKYTDK